MRFHVSSPPTDSYMSILLIKSLFIKVTKVDSCDVNNVKGKSREEKKLRTTYHECIQLHTSMQNTNYIYRINELK